MNNEETDSYNYNILTVKVELEKTRGLIFVIYPRVKMTEDDVLKAGNVHFMKNSPCFCVDCLQKVVRSYQIN